MPVAVAQRRHFKDKKIKQPPKQTHFGIEVAKGLVWKEWEPGGEYTKHVILKNVNVKTQKFKYSSPSSRFFSTLYPEPIVLSAGTSFTLPVTFRPLEKNVYEDTIEFHTQDGSFKIPIVAVLPKYELSLPDHLFFGMCASRDQVEVTFELQNVSELKTDFRWFVGLPFTLEPSAGCLEPKSKCTITATFKPAASLVYETVAECLFGDKLACKMTLHLEGIGKYPHLLVSPGGKTPSASENLGLESIISFGEVAIGDTGQRCIELHNLSPVNAPFTIQHLTKSRMDTVFHCTEHDGIVPPQSISKLPITFIPHTVLDESIDYLEVQAIGNVSKMRVKLHGKCKGPNVVLGSPVLDFGRINSGDSSTCTLKIINNSSVTAAFQFMIDGSESIFHFGVDYGTIQPDTTQTIIIQFKPVHPINYFRRVACLVQSQDPLFVDLIGTCHTELDKPAVLQPKHLTNYRVHEDRGFSVFPPEQLNEMLKEGKLQQDPQGALMHPRAEKLEKYLQPPEQIPSMKEFFSSPYSKTSDLPLHISMDVHEVDFGCCQHLQHLEQRTINITNHTKGKITIIWMGDSSHVFSVSPVMSDIPPLKMTSFRVSFKPDTPNQFYGSELEGYAFYKSMRDYRLVQDETFAPPWCLTVSAVGSTFQPGHDTFLPRYTIDNTKLVFPAVDVGDSAYKTMLLTNIGDTPIHYRIPDDPYSIFQIKPRLGLISRKQQMFAAKSSPKVKNTRLQHQFKWLLNESDKHTLDVLVTGSSEQPTVLLDSQGVLYFKPTCLGTSSSRTYKVQNISRVPLRYEWVFAHADQAFLRVEPMNGTILPNESQPHIWTFTPLEERKYVFKPYIQVEDVKHIGDATKRKRVALRVIGDGSQGEINAEEPMVDLSYIVVGTAIGKDIAIYNSSNCTLHYKLYVDQTLEGSYAEEIAEKEPIALELATTHGIIPARSRCLVHATVRPHHRMTYKFNISYELCMPELDQGESSIIKGSKKPLCEMTGVGLYPALQVTDARCYGSAAGISKSRLWKIFSLDNFNMSLESDPLPEELNYVIPTRHITARKMETNTRAVMDYNFSAAPVGCEPCVVHLMLENKGNVATDWAFLFPIDMHLELEYWAETGEFDVEELHEMRVMDNKLFTIEPSKGHLVPGQQQAITFSYKHDFAGTDRLPVMFKVSRGREILLNFVGVTVDPMRKYVHFPSNKHMFEPVAIGNDSNPHQIYEMYNGGALSVEYYLDLTALEILQKDNFDQTVLACLNPKGTIGPGKTANIEWIFAPLEAQTYTVSVPIHIIGGDTALITFSGIGYDSRILGKTLPTTDQFESQVPVTQKVQIPGQMVCLSQERISFGNMPVFSQSRRSIYVKNNSPDHAVSFEWFVTSEADGQVIDIQPASATLESGEVCMCKICFTAIGEPSFYDIDVICEVTDDQVIREYRTDLENWEKEKERQRYEFIITDSDLKPPSSHERLCSTIKTECGRQSASPDEFKKYNTLPPIKNVRSDKELEIHRIKERQTDTGTPLWQKPTPPEPFVLHLGVTGRTMCITEYQNYFPNEVGKFYIDRSMGDRHRSMSQTERDSEDTKEEEETRQECSEGERDVIEGTVANIIRALLDDHDFHEALTEILKEPIPYFTQFEDPQTLRGEARLISPPLTASQDNTDREATIKEDSIARQGQKDTEIPSQTMEQSMDVEAVPPSTDIQVTQERRPMTDLCGRTDNEYQQSLMEERLRDEQQLLKRDPEFGILLELVLENTIFNIVSESLNREVNLTARPRLIALPPSQKPQTPPKGRVGQSRSGSVASVRSEMSQKFKAKNLNNNSKDLDNGVVNGADNGIDSQKES